MRLAVAGLGLFGVVGVASVVLWLNLRSFGAALREPPRIEREGFVPVTSDDLSWLGTYRLYSSSSEIELRAQGSYRTRFLSKEYSPDETIDLLPPPDFEGKWSREGSTLLLTPNDNSPAQRFELGRLDGGYVLLTEFCAWRRVR